MSRSLSSTSIRRSVRPVLEPLEERTLLSGMPELFASQREFEQFVIEAAVRQWQWAFGATWSDPWVSPGDGAPGIALPAVASAAGSAFSRTNTQEAGVDEGDIVKTDGSYLYLISGDELTILDARPGRELDLVSRTPLDGFPLAQYLDGDRLTVLSAEYPDEPRLFFDTTAALSIWPDRGYATPQVTVQVFDVADRAAPRLVQATTLDGNYLTSRAIGNHVYLVVQNYLGFQPAPEVKEVAGVFRYETEAEFRARLANGGLSQQLPQFFVVAAGQSLPSRPLAVAANTYRPTTQEDFNLLTLLAFDVTAERSGPVDVVNIFGAYWAEAYASPTALYLAAPHWTADGGATTDLTKFTLRHGDITATATGTVPGMVLNQFAMDEADNTFRITTTTGWGPLATTGLYVLADRHGTLERLGTLEGLAPGERLFAARFFDDHAFLVTFEQVDPLFTIDLSDPTAPRLVGELKLPGFSRYLHPVGDSFLLGIGRDADPATGQTLGLQVTLFDVSNLATPRVVDQHLIDPPGWVWSEAEYNHHAISFFPEYGVLTLPVSGYDPDTWRIESHLYVFHLNPTEIDLLGRVGHESPVRRSVLVGDRLFSVAYDAVQVQPLMNPEATSAVRALSDPAINAEIAVVQAVAGQVYSGVVGTFTLAAPDAVTAVINWGDGRFSNGTVRPNAAGGFDVFGEHRYATAGNHNISVELIRDGDNRTYVHGTAEVVADNPHVRFVTQLYRDLLGRDPEPAGLAFWRGLLEQGRSRLEVVRGIEGSQEYRTAVIARAYAEVLGRTPDPLGQAAWLDYLDRGGSVLQLRAQILGSEEYLARFGGGTHAGYLDAVYRTLLNRAIDPTGAAGWGHLLNAGWSRTAVAAAILSSEELFTIEVRQWYAQYLQRPADGLGLQLFVSALRLGISDREALSWMLASEEYFVNAG